MSMWREEFRDEVGKKESDIAFNFFRSTEDSELYQVFLPSIFSPGRGLDLRMCHVTFVSPFRAP